MKKVLNVLRIIFKFLWNILKHIILLPLYCSMPDKYSGVTYSELLNSDNEQNDNKK